MSDLITAVHAAAATTSEQTFIMELEGGNVELHLRNESFVIGPGTGEDEGWYLWTAYADGVPTSVEADKDLEYIEEWMTEWVSIVVTR